MVKGPGFAERHLALSPSSALISGCPRMAPNPSKPGCSPSCEENVTSNSRGMEGGWPWGMS